jgi:hypothetical protein
LPRAKSSPDANASPVPSPRSTRWRHARQASSPDRTKQRRPTPRPRSSPHIALRGWCLAP